MNILKMVKFENTIFHGTVGFSLSLFLGLLFVKLFWPKITQDFIKIYVNPQNCPNYRSRFQKTSKVHKVTELMMMARRAMSKLNFPRFVSLYSKRILVWGSVSLRVASDKAREIQFGHSPSCHHHQFCHFMNFREVLIFNYFWNFGYSKPAWQPCIIDDDTWLLRRKIRKLKISGGSGMRMIPTRVYIG